VKNILKKILFTNNSECTGSNKEIRICESNQIICEKSKPYWSEWSEWSSCKNSCKSSEPEKQSRTRSCLLNKLNSWNCTGLSKEKRACPKENRCINNRTESIHGPISEWSNWSRCLDSYDRRGFKTRIRACRKKNQYYPCEIGRGEFKKDSLS